MKGIAESESESSSPSSESSFGADEYGPAKKLIHELNIESLWAFSVGEGPCRRSTYASNGSDPVRIKNRLQGEGACKCMCHKRFHFKHMLDICTSFWALDKKHQDRALWAAACAGDWHTHYSTSAGDDDEEGSGTDDDDGDDCSAPLRKPRKQWLLAGVQVCRKAFCKLLGLVLKKGGPTTLVLVKRSSRMQESNSS